MPIGSGTKLEAVRRAIIKGFASFVYGLNDYDEYNYELEVPDLDFFPGKLIVKRIDALNLIYAITEVGGCRGLGGQILVSCSSQSSWRGHPLSWLAGVMWAWPGLQRWVRARGHPGTFSVQPAS
jgi:hypothetical protein